MDAHLPPVLGTGLSGLVGTRLVDLLSDQFTFINLDKTTGVDIMDEQSVAKIVDPSPAQVLLHLAAITDVNMAQTENGDRSGITYRINVEGTRIIAEACARTEKHLIHISTGYVFDGEKTEPYVETDPTNPVDWYSQTKLEAEQVVQEVAPNATILRINFPYRTDDFPKRDLWHKMADNIMAGKNGPFFEDHFFTLTPVEWLAPIIAWCIRTKPAGIFHATTDTRYSDYTLAQEVMKSLGVKQELVHSSVHAYNETAERPYAPSLVLSSEKLKQAMASHP